MENLPLLSDLAPETRFQRIDFPVAEGWSLFNPSIARTDHGFLCTVRNSTAYLKDGRYILTAGRFPIFTENYFVQLDGDLRPVTVDLLIDASDRSRTFESRTRGFEDLRLFQTNGTWLASATTTEHDPDVLNQTTLLQFEGNRITQATLLSSPWAGHQKNWMPVLGMPHPTFVTHCSPTTVVQFDVDREISALIANHRAPLVARRFRGGSHLVPLADGFVCLIHEVLTRSAGKRQYVHRLVHFNPDFQIDALSPRFHFLVPEIEFCAGLALHDGQFVISFGVNDCQAWLAKTPAPELFRLLASVP